VLECKHKIGVNKYVVTPLNKVLILLLLIIHTIFF